jgi:crotonobetainyl-CoA:carnitine CoA-transferase CaiB-like acyl-CoA transferase
MLLRGLRVVEYATYIAAPGAGGILADWGADVIKIEPPGGDPIRLFFDSIGADMGANPVFELDNRGKRSVMLNTTNPAARDAMLKLIDSADIFITNVRPGGLARAGLDFETLGARNPRLIYASVTGYGLSGDDADRPGFDIAAFWSRSGMAALTAPKGTDPFHIRTGMGDHVTSLSTASGILAALYEREKTGKGRLVEASLLRAANYVLGSDMAIQMAFGRVASNRPRQDQIQPLANFFKTKDNQWICLVPRQGEADWPGICRALDLVALQGDARFAKSKARRENKAALMNELDAAFARFDYSELAKRLDEAALPWAPVQTAAQAANDPQLAAAGGVVQTPRPNGDTLKAPGGPLRFPGIDDGPKGYAPRPGEHTRVILSSLGYAERDIDALIAQGGCVQWTTDA